MPEVGAWVMGGPWAWGQRYLQTCLPKEMGERENPLES